jgi:hypothetical protein
MASSDLNIAIPGPLDLVSSPLRSIPVQLAAGSYVEGEVLGLTGNVYGKLTSAAAAAAVMPFTLVLAAQATTAVYVEGDFNEDALSLNGQTLADVKTALRKVGIMARKWGAAPSVS